MAIRPDELDLVLDELAPLLTGARLQEVRVPAPDRAVLTLRSPGVTRHLMLVVQSTHARLHTIDRPPPNPPRALAMQGLLRQLLRGVCRGLERVGDDRIVRLGLGDLDLMVELTGHHGNLFILDRDGTIRASLLTNRSHRRALVVDQPWTPPASSPPPSRPARFQPPDVGRQLADHYATLELQEHLIRARARASRRLRSVERKLSRKYDRQLAEADRIDDAAALRREADLLNASFGQLRRGQDSVELVDVFDETCPRVTLSLDPRLTPRQTIERRYHAARRLERGSLRATEEALRTEEEVGRARAALDRISSARDEAAIADVVAGLPRPWRVQAPPAGRRARPAVRLPYRAWRTPGGQRILVGRGAVDNDELTFRHARGRDVWMHVVGRPGAHVVIPLAGGGPDLRALASAAQLVVAASGLSEGDTAEVAWTRVKYVRKVKGAAPGLVTYSQERVMYVKRERAATEDLEPTD
jgi:predicted ribosome quality control (RQC) complex YloA/Tae2 family protein